ncbi:MAG: hypothetical protein ACI9HK_005846, partial [Pirellulaceae bacterium]
DAAALGRPVGVWLDREPGSAFESSRMSIAETPPLFMGAFDNSQARIGRSTLTFVDTVNGGTFQSDEMAIQFSDPLDLQLLGEFLVRTGHLANTGTDDDFIRDAQFWIKFSFRGPWYAAVAKWDSNRTLACFIRDYSSGCSVNEGGTGGCPVVDVGQRFQLRLPPQRGIGDAMQLPAGTVVDLKFSGFDSFGTELSHGVRVVADEQPTEPVIVMFNPNGSIQHVYGVTNQPLSFVHLLLGDSEKVVAFVDEARLSEDDFYAGTNIKSVENYWVSVGNLTGNVLTSENASPVATNAGADVFNPQGVPFARQFANAASSIGGR